MRLAQISDLHIQAAEQPRAGPTSVDVAEAVADDLLAIADGLDAVIVAGDLTEHADADSFAVFEQLFGRIDLPILVVPGNHDGPSGMLDYISNSRTLARWDITNRVVEVGGIRFFGLNTCVENLTQGALDAHALALLKREVRRDSELPLAIVMHHPPLLLGLDQFDGFCKIERGDAFLDILSAAEQEMLIFSGHVHRPYSARQGMLTCHVAGSMIAPHDSHRPFGSDAIRPVALQDFYYVHDINPGGPHVITPQRVRSLTSGGDGTA